MTHYAVGQSTNTVYAKGTKADCLRKLHAEFPSFTNRKGNLKEFGKAIGSILPETVMIIRK
ncbi:hypothetical protein [Psychrobacillus antarcticus]|uniref:hypothetical protein n=1 Tax=Psychrobacillus antarcticus TaxID=2879115 RepID=UPI002408336A|nr:hypothetical protein [Psychrobacillus antarcticus]